MASGRQGAGSGRFSGQSVLVVGFGRSGQAAAELLAREGAKASAVDDDAALAKAIDAGAWRARGVEVHLGPTPPGDLGRPDLVVVSPGVPATSAWMRWAEGERIPVIGEIELAWRVARAPIAAVTGTNGKSTTTELLGEVVRAWGRPVGVGGNIGRALSTLAPNVPPEGWLVVEVSSFQLETIREFRPAVAIHLNLTPDHLDRYGSVEEYGRAKARVFENQTEDDVAVLNADDPAVWSLRNHLRARVLAVRRTGPVAEGAWAEGGRLVARLGGVRHDLLGADEVRIRGPHNLANALAVSAAALSMGAPPEAVARALRNFAGLPHRMESVGRVGGVEFVNDSKATNVEAVLSALASFPGSVVLVAGGRGKGLDFAALAGAAAGRVRRAVLIGESAGALERVLGNVTEVETAGTLGEAVRRAYEAARPGGTVLLSPACASFDMFRNFEDRGDRFREEVRTLREEVE